MTPAEETRFIALWQQGLTTDAIAQQLGIVAGTARSRAYTLQQQGKIGPRPRGGRRQRTVQNGVEHGAVQVQIGAELPIPAAIVEELTRVWAAIDALCQDVHRPVQSPVQSLPEPLFDDPADNTTERWNLYLKRGLRVRIEALAQARGVAPSRVVQELLWHALSDAR
jgi:hypothetical protein